MKKIENGYIERISDHVFDIDYLNSLIVQFNEAMGKKLTLNDLKNSSILREFSQWLAMRRKQTDDYYRLLSYMNYNTLPYFHKDAPEDACVADLRDTCELYKGEVDSVVAYTDASVISPYAGTLDKNNRKFLARGSHVPSFTKLVFARRSDGRIIRIKDDAIKTILLQNPTDSSQYAGLNNLHLCGKYQIIFGVYGNVHDKDRKKKIKEFLKVARTFPSDPCLPLETNILYDDTIIGSDTYYGILVGAPTDPENYSRWKVTDFSFERNGKSRVRRGK